MHYKTFLFSLFIAAAFGAAAQSSSKIAETRCGTMPRLEAKFARNPALRSAFEAQRASFNRLLQQKLSAAEKTDGTTQVYTIPVVFHVVLTNPAAVTNAQLQAQLDTLNATFSGTVSYLNQVPTYFKSLFGNSGIQFCLAQRTPDGESTTGIERITTTKTSFSNLDDAVKYVSSGGADVWNPDNYFNIWICRLSNNILGYSTFPQDGEETAQGVVVDYRTLPGGSFTDYNSGKSATHETGHYFNLYHIWGDDDGACTGTDYVDDTPNQADATTGCYTGIKTDNCTQTGNGILYQDYMDYSSDNCMTLFTAGQVTRMESALLLYRSSLLRSDGCQPPVQHDYDAQLLSITQPDQRLCSATFMPVIQIKNRGVQTLTSLTITSSIDDGTATTYTWTGSLAQYATATVTLPNQTTTTGSHVLTVSVSQPNNATDEDATNNTASLTYQYYTPVTTVSESFESSVFPPEGWDLINPDNGITWQRASGIAKTGTASALINNFENTAIGQADVLRMPTVTIAAGVDSAFLSFQVAAAAYTATSTANNNWDTLEVLVSTDCGVTYTSLYKKWGSSLVTKTAAQTTAFTPTASEWRKDSINLASYIGAGTLVLAFKNTTGNENNIYLDDVNLRTVTINPNLKAQGFLVTPNPTRGTIAVQFYPQPTNLKAIQLFSATGQKLAEINASSGANNYYSFDLSKYANGTYFVRTIFSDNVITKKIVKQ